MYLNKSSNSLLNSFYCSSSSINFYLINLYRKSSIFSLKFIYVFKSNRFKFARRINSIIIYNNIYEVIPWYPSRRFPNIDKKNKFYRKFYKTFHKIFHQNFYEKFSIKLPIKIYQKSHENYYKQLDSESHKNFYFCFLKKFTIDFLNNKYKRPNKKSPKNIYKKYNKKYNKNFHKKWKKRWKKKPYDPFRYTICLRPEKLYYVKQTKSTFVPLKKVIEIKSFISKISNVKIKPNLVSTKTVRSKKIKKLKYKKNNGYLEKIIRNKISIKKKNKKSNSPKIASLLFSNIFLFNRNFMNSTNFSANLNLNYFFYTRKFFIKFRFFILCRIRLHDIYYKYYSKDIFYERLSYLKRKKSLLMVKNLKYKFFNWKFSKGKKKNSFKRFLSKRYRKKKKKILRVFRKIRKRSPLNFLRFFSQFLAYFFWCFSFFTNFLIFFIKSNFNLWLQFFTYVMPKKKKFIFPFYFRHLELYSYCSNLKIISFKEINSLNLLFRDFFFNFFPLLKLHLFISRSILVKSTFYLFSIIFVAYKNRFTALPFIYRRRSFKKLRFKLYF